jgi:carboxypeptidase C (cathepsin A)
MVSRWTRFLKWSRSVLRGSSPHDAHAKLKLLGPYILHDNLTLENNPHTWTRDFDVLFVDNPVGTGYSYVDPPAQVRPPLSMSN